MVSGPHHRIILPVIKLLSFVFLISLLAVPLDAQQYPKGALRLGMTGGVNVGGEEATLKYANYSAHPYGTFTLEHYLSNDIAVTASLLAGTLSAEISGRAQFPSFGDQLITGYNAKYYGLSGGLNFVLPALAGLTPVLRPRLGFLVHQTRVDGDGGFERRLSRAALTYGVGGGFEFPIARNIAFTFGYDVVFTNSDELDGLRSGTKNDALSVFTAGINVLIKPGGEPDRLRRPLEERFSTLQPTSIPVAERRTRTERGRDSLAAAGSAATAGDAAGNPDRMVLNDGSGAEGQSAETLPPLRPLTGGMGDREMRGLSVGRSPAMPGETALSVESGGSLQLFTRLDIAPIRRLADLEDNPRLFTLSASQTGDERMQLKCYVEMLRNGMVFYKGDADLLLDKQKQTFTAEDFLDLHALLDGNDGYALLPGGNYMIRVSTVAWDHELSSLSKAKFLNADLAPIFGPREDEARALIAREAVDVSLDGQDQLLVNFFGASEAAAERSRSEQKTPERMRAPLRLTPPSLTGQPREQHLAKDVEASFNEGLKLQSLAGNIGRSRNLKLVLAEVYFPIDSDMLSEESRIVLDNAARLLNQHPELFVEIRGYASDVGDETTNLLLAKRRAERVLEYLVRLRLNAYRVFVGPPGRQAPALVGEDARFGRKVEIILNNRGM